VRLSLKLTVIIHLICSLSHAISLSELPLLLSGQNEDIKAAEKDVEASESAISAARSRHYPSLSIRNTFVHLGDTIQVKVPTQTIPLGSSFSLAFELPPLEIDKQDFASSNLILSVPLFAGGRISAGVSASEFQRDEAKSNQSKVSQEKLQEAITRYFGVQLAKESLSQLFKMKENLDRIQKISEGLVRSGLGAKFSTLQIKVAQAELDSRIAEAKGKLALAELAFKTTLGKDTLGELTYETPLKRSKMTGDLETFKKTALSSREEFNLLKAKEGQARALKSVYLGEMLPTLYAVGGHKIWSYQSSLIEPHWAVGVVLEIPLTNWLGGIPNHAKAVALEDKVEILRSKAAKEIPLQVQKVYTEADTLNASLNALSESRSMSQEALRLAEIRFKNGDGAALEVLRAATDLEKSEIQYLLKTEELDRKILELFATAGKTQMFIEHYLKSI
jgi:outer membrane protein TolC